MHIYIYILSYFQKIVQIPSYHRWLLCKKHRWGCIVMHAATTIKAHTHAQLYSRYCHASPISRRTQRIIYMHYNYTENVRL